MVFSNSYIAANSKHVMKDEDFIQDFVRLLVQSRGRTGLRTEQLMPPARDVIHGALPSFRETTRESSEDFRELKYDPYKTRVYVNPKPDSKQIGDVGFDIRCGRIIAKCDTLIKGLGEKDLRDMEHRVLEEGESYELVPDPEGNTIYYVLSFEEVDYSKNLMTLIDSRSTAARLGCLTHDVGRTTNFNLVTAIQPLQFPLKVTCGRSRLSQAVIRYINSPFMVKEEIQKSNQVSFNGEGVSLEDSLNSLGIQMRFRLNERPIFEAKPYNRDEMPPINIDAPNQSLDWETYYRLLSLKDKFRANKRTLYLLGSYGVIGLKGVCGILSKHEGVMTGINILGNLAGFVQPFWAGEITMEYWSPMNAEIRNGEFAGHLLLDKIEGEIKNPAEVGYQGQIAPALPKMFKQPSL